MRKSLYLISSLAFSVSLFSASASALKLEGDFIQGGFVVGKTEPGSKIMLGDRKVMINEEGQFAFGFGRDHGGEAALVVTGPDGTKETRALTIAPQSYHIERVEGIAKKYVSPPPEVLERIKREGAVKKKARAVRSFEKGFVDGFAWPVEGRISGVFGSQRFYNGKPGRPHYGIDIAACAGTKFFAPADGVVTLSDDDMYYEGGLIFLDHGHGVMSAFLHLSGVDVKPGDRVKKGDLLGRIGAAGRANGPHLDWRIYWTDQRLDPALVMDLPADAGYTSEEAKAIAAKKKAEAKGGKPKCS